jgi:hypothetical protein
MTCTNGICGGTGTTPTPSGNLSPGQACNSVNQCSQAGGAILCADNGYADDGPLNCCRTTGGACSDTVRSADCCFGYYCRNGTCTDLSATGQLPLGSACETSSQCDQSGGPATCASGRCAAGGPPPSTGGGLTPGTACTSSAQCRQRHPQRRRAELLPERRRRLRQRRRLLRRAALRPGHLRRR